MKNGDDIYLLAFYAFGVALFVLVAKALRDRD